MRYLRGAALAVLSFACMPSFAQAPADAFAVLDGAAVTCTTSNVDGSLGLANTGTITNTGCVVAGTIEAGTPAAQSAYSAFLTEYANVATQPPCQYHNVPLAGAFLSPGVYCYDAAVTVT